MFSPKKIFIKICGITLPEQAQQISHLKPDAIGFIFYKKSPRNLTLAQAEKIAAVIPKPILKTGVFVNADLSFIEDVINTAHLDLVQLHGNEDKEYIEKLQKKADVKILKVIKDLENCEEQISNLPENIHYLIEIGKGELPGGNGIGWDWSLAKKFPKPFIIAGGITPENAKEALDRSGAFGIDISSGVEISPGIKDLAKVFKIIKIIKPDS